MLKNIIIIKQKATILAQGYFYTKMTQSSSFEFVIKRVKVIYTKLLWSESRFWLGSELFCLPVLQTFV